MHLVTVVAAVAAQPNYVSGVFWIALALGAAKVLSLGKGKKRP